MAQARKKGSTGNKGSTKPSPRGTAKPTAATKAKPKTKPKTKPKAAGKVKAKAQTRAQAPEKSVPPPAPAEAAGVEAAGAAAEAAGAAAEAISAEATVSFAATAFLAPTGHSRGPGAASARLPARLDDRPLEDLAMGLVGYPAVLLAQHLRLFPLLQRGPSSASEIAAMLNLRPRSIAAILSLCTALGLLDQSQQDGVTRYGLSPTAEMYLLPHSPVYYGDYLDTQSVNDQVYSFAGLKQALLTDQVQLPDGPSPEVSYEEQVLQARHFTRYMHSHSMAAALSWPQQVDLSRYEVLLDIGGGSGAHAIGAAMNWPHLRAVVLDMPLVAAEAARFIADKGLSDRISTAAADMWSAALPLSDLHLYSQILQLYPPEQGQVLLQRSFDSLPPGGRILVHEMLYHDDKRGPFAAAAQSVALMLWTQGQVYSGAELSEMLRRAGFVDVEVRSTLGYWGIVTGRRP